MERREYALIEIGDCTPRVSVGVSLSWDFPKSLEKWKKWRKLSLSLSAVLLSMIQSPVTIFVSFHISMPRATLKPINNPSIASLLQSIHRWILCFSLYCSHTFSLIFFRCCEEDLIALRWSAEEIGVERLFFWAFYAWKWLSKWCRFVRNESSMSCLIGGFLLRCGIFVDVIFCIGLAYIRD